LEIGSWHGRSTRTLAENSNGVVYAVDTWKGTSDEIQSKAYLNTDLNQGDHAFLEFCKNNGDLIDIGKIIPIRMHSANANWVFGVLGLKFDMIFIDGDHTYSAVKSDIIGTKNLLAKGALLCGHDYSCTGWAEVKQATDELIHDVKIIEDTSLWYTISI